MTDVQQLLDVFETYRMAPTADDMYDTTGKSILADKMSPYVSLKQKIPFVMLGFPFKSTNTRDKVIGQVPDRAEQLTLENFAQFDRDIKAIYAPGVEISIVSDGFIFNDLMAVSDSVVEEYKEISMDMGRVAPMQWYDIRDFYGKDLSVAREKVVEHFGITPEKLASDILTNRDVNYLYTGMIKFMEEEKAMETWPSHNQLQKAAKRLAREMMFRNEAYSNLVREEFKRSIRLSMHPSVNNGAKYSFQLIKGTSHYSAWHSAAVDLGNGEFTTIHKKDAEVAGYELVYDNNKPFYYLKK